MERAVTIDMLPSTILSTRQCLQPIYHPDWRQQVFSPQMYNTLMILVHTGTLEEEWQAPCVSTTCPDTFTHSHLAVPPSSTLAEQNKLMKHSVLDQCHSFAPMAIETAHSFGPETFLLLREVGCCLKQVTGEAKSFCYCSNA